MPLPLLRMAFQFFRPISAVLRIPQRTLPLFFTPPTLAGTSFNFKSDTSGQHKNAIKSLGRRAAGINLGGTVPGRCYIAGEILPTGFIEIGPVLEPILTARDGRP